MKKYTNNIMYSSYGLLLLLCISVVHGESIQCCVGGIIESECQDLINETVLQTYVFNYETITNYKKTYDAPYGSLEKRRKLEMGNSKSEGKAVKVCESKNHELFRSPDLYLKQLYIQDVEHYRDSMKNILTGTDIYRIKAYRSMRVMSSEFTSYMLRKLYEPCYNVASTHYFNRNYALALSVLQEGISYITTSIMKEENNYFEFRQEMCVWSVLYYTLMLDAMNNLPDARPKEIGIYKNRLSREEKQMEKNLAHILASNQHPYVILMYRKFFLDKDLPEEKKQKLKKVAREKLQKVKEADYPRQFLSIYYELVAASIEPDAIRAIKILSKAIYSPASSTEDRLLNYKANEMAKKIVDVCIDENGWINQSDNTLCHELDNMRDSNEELSANGRTIVDSMLTKYTQEKMFANIIKNTQANLNSGTDIDENLLHTIVTGVIDMDSEIQKEKINTVKTGISILIEYISKQYKLMEDEKSERNSKNLVIAYKWLAELNAVLCMGFEDITEEYPYESDAIQSLIIAIDLAKNVDANMSRDKHLQYLRTKLICSSEFLIQSWESRVRLDGWVLNPSENDLIELQDDFEEENCLGQFHSFLTVNHPFIHKSDVLINYYRCRLKEKYKSYANTITSGYLKQAMSIPVINSEDRYRNSVAHELYSMHLLKFNSIPGRERFKDDLKFFNF